MKCICCNKELRLSSDDYINCICNECKKEKDNFEFTLSNGSIVIIKVWNDGLNISFNVLDKTTNKNISFDLSQEDFDLICEKICLREGRNGRTKNNSQ